MIPNGAESGGQFLHLQFQQKAQSADCYSQESWYANL